MCHLGTKGKERDREMDYVATGIFVLACCACFVLSLFGKRFLQFDAKKEIKNCFFESETKAWAERTYQKTRASTPPPILPHTPIPPAPILPHPQAGGISLMSFIMLELNKFLRPNKNSCA